MKLILFILLSFPLLCWAKTPEDIELRKSIRKQMIQEEKECAGCVKMHPEMLEREVDRVFASEKNKRRQNKEGHLDE